MNRRSWKRLLQAWVITLAVVALLAWPMHLGRTRLIEGGASALAVATVIGLYERPGDGSTSRHPTV
jgi:hypothetical protein